MSLRTRILSLLVVVTLVTVAHAAPRRRSVRVPATQCTFSLSAAFGDPISEGGVVRGRISVSGAPASTCASWSAYSNASWITVETDASAAYVTVGPNNSADVRTGSVLIAGVQYQVTQLGHVVPPEVNLLANGTFNLDLRRWGWQDRFPNGTGDATWSSLDANNNIASGSMRIRDDTNSAQGYQQLQCVNVSGPGSFDFGAAVRVAAPSSAVAALALVEYDTTDCTGNYRPYRTQIVQSTQANAWQRVKYTALVFDTAKSVSLILVGAARTGSTGLQEVWFDDVFLRPSAQ